MLNKMWTTRNLTEAAAAGGRPVTQEYIRQLCQSGDIPAIKPSRDWFMQEKDARAWLARWLDGGTGKGGDGAPDGSGSTPREEQE